MVAAMDQRTKAFKHEEANAQISHTVRGNYERNGLQRRTRHETYKSMINIGTEALKVLLLLNGGAIVALLGYLGQVSNRADLARQVWAPLVCFVGGLVAVALAFLFTYFVQFTLYNEDLQGPNHRGMKHMALLKITVVLSLISLGLFCFGAVVAVRVLAGSC